jgi:hypothetical protein
MRYSTHILGYSRASLFILLACCLVLSCGSPGIILDCYSVEMRVHDTSCASADVGWSIWSITWEDNGHEIVPLPWSRTLDLCTADIEFWAQRQCNDAGIVTVEIYVDGTLRRIRTGEGAGATARVELWID